MKLKGSIDKLREQIFREKSKKRRLPFALKIKELENTFNFIDVSKWRVNSKDKNQE